MTPLQIRVNQGDAVNLSSFFKTHDFSLTLQNECPQINIEKSLQNRTKQNVPAEFHIKKYSDLNTTESDLLRKFRLSGYVKTHFWSPPVHVGSDIWKHTDLTHHDKQISWAVLKGNQIILCSDAHLYDDEVWLGWGWHNDSDEYTGAIHQLWSKVLRLQLRFCQNSGKALFGEFDSLDKYGQFKSRLLVHQTQNTSYIYQQKSER
ncbi:hypothetical protein [Vibrio quintilis]|uniref:Uncharacterized protein n=1 Tax=Vibrio quintilis TaxID=1117707 RepID=A0A1M7YQV7_9VIBR|nr:hypothetical protein [Vibrio quintilis]SHO55023.1 hypothetical protein VQ7734_00742 [Vibrio quintilis]